MENSHLLHNKKIKVLAVLLLSLMLLISCEKKEETDKDNTENRDNEEIITETQSDDTAGEVKDTEIPEGSEDEIQNAEQEEIPEITGNNKFSVEKPETFYDNAVFIGDSVMKGLEMYSFQKETPLSNATFLTLESFSAYHAMTEVSETSLHPVYNGKKMRSEDAISLCEAKKVFLFVGLNDVLFSKYYDYNDGYIKFVESIKETNPDVDIFILSATYPISKTKLDPETNVRYKTNLSDLNYHMQKYCDENEDIYFIDVCTPLLSSNGYLADEYSSDSYVHLTWEAYRIWTEKINSYVNDLIISGKPQETDSEFVPIENS